MRRILATSIATALALSSVSAPSLAQTTAQAAPAPAVTDATTQLPRDVRPTHYQVAVIPHADKLTFNGTVAITLEVLAPTDSITLNAVDMTFANVELGTAASDAPAMTPQVAIDAAAQTATFSFDKPLPV